MNKLFKYTKQTLSVVLVLSLLLVSIFTGTSINIKANATENIVYWDGTSTPPDESKTDKDGNILINNAAELHYIAIELGTENSTGKTYKIADGIDVIILQPEGTVDTETLMGLTDYNAVKTYLTETVSSPKNWLDGIDESVRFNGSFDGNGVQIYGMYATGAAVGLFPCGDGGTVYTTEGHTGCVYQNFAVRNSYLESTRRLGVIAAYSAGGIGIGTVTAKNCEVSNCYIISTAIDASYFAEAGVLIGRTNNELVKVDNCLVYGNYSYATELDKQIPLYPCAYTGDSSALNTVENTVVLGTTPYPTNSTSSKTHGVKCFENVYTDAELPTYAAYADTDMKQVVLEDIKGDAASTQMPGLDWTNTWITVENGYPALRAFYDVPTGGGESGNDENGDTSDTLCTKNIIYWSGEKTPPDETKTDSEGNIIISTAEELNYIATTASSGKSYKIADDIDVIILQPEASVDAEILMGLTDYNAVKTYFTETITPTPWSTVTTDPDKVVSSFDGNGVEIYGLYINIEGDNASAGLFPGVDGGTTFQNFALRNSYLQSNRRIGVIGAYCAGGTADTVIVKNCEVSNCYISNTSTDSSNFSEMGVLLGRTTKDYINVENCLIYGNYNYADGLSKSIPLYAGAASGTISTIENSVILGTSPYPTALTANDYTHSVNCFENVYTDAELPTYAAYADTDIKQITESDILGDSAKTQMPDLAWDDVWITIEGKLPALSIFYTDTTSDDTDNGENEGDEGDTPQENETATDCAQNIIYWDSTKTDSSLADSGETGSSDNPIIIDNAEELNYLALYTSHSNSTEKHYKISDSIDAIILQSEDAVTAMGGAGKIMNLTSATAVNQYFTDMQTAGYTPSNWITTAVGNQFNGSVDGNGVKIYGMYAVATAGTNSAEAAGLFPVIDAGGTVANTEVETDFVGVSYTDIAVRNSYISSTRRIGALIGISYGTNFGAKVNGTVNIDGVEISNCYIRATGTTDGEKGVLTGSLGTDLVNINNCLVYGNNTSWNNGTSTVALTLVGTTASIIDAENNTIENTFKNSIVLDTSPTPQSVEDKFNRSENVENVYTNYDISALVSRHSYTNSNMVQLTSTSSAAIGAEIGTGLNATGKWLTVTDGMPTLYALHSAITVVSSNDCTHTIKCDCGIESNEVAHAYNSDYKCMLCDYQHSHNMIDNGVQTDSNCVSGGIMNTLCENCGFESTREIQSAGHQFGDIVAATDGDCQTETTVAYKHCSVCELDFLADADNHSSQPLEHIGTGYTGKHNWVEQAELASECSAVSSVEYFMCSVCNTYLVEGVMTETAPSEIKGHSASGNYFLGEDYHADICSLCGENFNSAIHTDANGDSICDTCSWPCGESVFKGASITITDSIAINYMINKNVIDSLSYNNIYVAFVFDGKNYTVSKYTETDEYYIFTFDDVGPQHMNCTIYATLHGEKDGIKYASKTSEYSIKKYCYNMLEKYADNIELRTLLVDMLNYGAASQTYDDHNTNDLANTALTDTQKAWGTQECRELNTCKNLAYETVVDPLAVWKGAMLHLDKSATLCFTVQAENIQNLSVKATFGTKTVEIASSEFVLRTDGKGYYVYVRDLTVAQMSEPVFVTVYSGDTPVSNTVSYSIESYAQSKVDGSDELLSDLLYAMIKYGDAAKNFIDAQ